jgi:hypothetical protein
MTAGAKHIPENRRIATLRVIAECENPDPTIDFLVRSTGLGNTRQIALNIRGENRHARPGKTFGKHLQGDGLTGTGRTGDQTMAVALACQLGNRKGFAPADAHGNGLLRPVLDLLVLAHHPPGARVCVVISTLRSGKV